MIYICLGVGNRERMVVKRKLFQLLIVLTAMLQDRYDFPIFYLGKLRLREIKEYTPNPLAGKE